MHGNGIFVTGTDTGVGKTTVCAALVCLLRGARVDAVPMKPVQTGAVGRGGRLVAPDLEFCLSMAGLEPGNEERRLMAPFCFQEPCSPHLAAAKAARRIEIGCIVTAFRKLARRRQAVIVEGSGGILVPLGTRRTMLDLMVRLGLPVVLAARPGLGTINHTLMSLRELKRAGLTTEGVVFVETTPSPRGDVEKDNAKTIERLGGVKVLGRIPFMAGLASGRVGREAFIRNCGVRGAKWAGYFQ